MKNILSRNSIFAALLALVLLATQSAQARSFKPDSKEYKTAKSALLSASVIVLGLPYTDVEINQRLVEFDAPPYNMGQKYDEGLKFSEAVDFLKLRLKKDSFDRILATNMAYLESMGRQGNDNERSYWQGRILNEDKLWYATMLPTFNDYVKTNKDERKATINRVYLAVFGRPAKSTDTNYWLNRSENYRAMREANRQYLWSEAGKLELTAMLTMCYQKISGKNEPMTDKAYQFFLFLHQKKKQTFEEIKKEYPTVKW